MSNKELLHLSLDNFEWNFKQVIEGFRNENLLARNNPQGNHLAWLLGHAIKSEKTIVEMVKPNSMPDLPEDFGEKHIAKTANSENAEEFYTLEEYLSFASEIRKGTRAVIDSLTDEDLDKEIAKDDSSFVKTGNNAILFVSQHWFWHIGQMLSLRKFLQLDK